MAGIDQLVSGLSNVAATFASVYVATTQFFGQVTMAAMIFAFALSVSRAGLGAHVSLGAEHGPAGVAHALRRSRRLMVIWTPGCLAIGLTVLWLSFGSETSIAVIGVVCIMPVLLWQDLLRFAAFAIGRETAALAMDTLWLVQVLGSWGVVVLNPQLPQEFPILVWGLAGGSSAVLGVFLLRPVMRLRTASDLPKPGHSVARFSLGGLASAGSILGRSWIVTSVLGASALGTLGAAGLTVTPLNLFVSVIPLFLVPRIAVRRRGASGQGTALAVFSVSWVIWALFLLVGPQQPWQWLLGSSFQSAAPLTWLMLALAIPIGIGTVGSAVLTGRSQSHSLMVLLMATAIARVAGAAWGALVPGTVEALVAVEILVNAGFAVAVWLTVWRLPQTSIAPEPAWDAPQGEVDSG